MEILSVAILASFVMFCGNIGYIIAITKGIIPTKSTWIIFACITTINVSTFLSSKFDLISGAYMITDAAIVLLILTFTLIYAKKSKVRFKSFEKYYLLGTSICIIFWIISSNPFVTNLLIQVMIVIGYIPTMHNILIHKKSFESKSSWIVWLVGSFLSIYPPIANSNILATIHSVRATAMCIIMVYLTHKFQVKINEPKNTV